MLAEDHYIAGNLRLHMPDVTVAEPEYGLWPVRPGGRTVPVLLAWSGKRDRPPQALVALYGQLCGPGSLDEKAVPTRLTEPYEHGAQGPLRARRSCWSRNVRRATPP